MSETSGDPTTTVEAAAAPPEPVLVHEAYAFACLDCGFGWEQAYEIGHGADRDGRPTTYYRANGVPVPSPLSRPNCPGCGGAHVRIMRAGRVAETNALWHAATHPHGDRPHAPERPRKERRLHLPFHFGLRRRHTTPEG